MASQVWSRFSGKRVLLLQGPVGPFFARVARALRDAGAATVHKVNFSGGDWYFYRDGAINFTGSLDDWPPFLADLLDRLGIDAILLFGDCRQIHEVAIAQARDRRLPYWVFEEGYIRPNYVTFEPHGVNGNSALPRDPAFYAALPDAVARPEQEVGATFGLAARWAMLYYTAGTLAWPFFRHRLHHRSLNMLEGLVWVRSYWRKLHYARAEAGVMPRLTGRWSKKFFLVALQTSGDFQVRKHSGFGSVENFITHVARSFAAHAPAETWLVFKHHPLDRGYTDYAALIERLGTELGISSRIKYIHDQHLPTLLGHARGVVVINSTVGLSALHHQTPTITLGKAIYNLPGLTFQGGLQHFWTDCEQQRPQLSLYWQFRNHVVEQTQLNGSFYKPLPGSDASGLVGGPPPALPLAETEPPAARPLPEAGRAGREPLGDALGAGVGVETAALPVQAVAAPPSRPAPRQGARPVDMEVQPSLP